MLTGLRLLTGKVLELVDAPSCSYETIRQLLEKHSGTLAVTGMVHRRSERGVCGSHKRHAGLL